MPTVREAAFKVFEHFGVDRLFGNPGSTELPMLKAMPFPYVMGLNEAVVMGMADGYARASGRPALVNLHSSAGTGHSLGNLFTAYKNNAPVVVTAGQQARSILPHDPFLFAERPTEFPRPYVKFSVEPARAEDVPLALARAFATAMTPPMGPVFVSIPVDDWDRECEMPALPDLILRTMPDPAGIERLANMLDAAENPALVLGTGVANCGGWESAIALAERCGASVWAAPYAARETFPEDHPQFAGFLPAWRDQLRDLLSGHDAILVAGAPVFTYHVEGSGPHWPAHAKLAALSDDPQHLASLPGGGGVLGDVAAGLQSLAQKVTARAWSGTPRKLAEPQPDMNAAHVLKRVAALRPAEAVIVEEAPTARGPEHDTLPITREGGFYTCASGGLGYSLPAAIGIALGQNDKVIAILGDGASMYTIQGLFAAKNEKANVSFVVLNNSAYAALTGFSAEFGMNHVPGCDLTGLDFVKLAEAQGVAARKVEQVDSLDAALAWSFGTDGPTLLDIRIS
ncbi:benzoylformate decarboxylase [Altererythrobacter atlanticus]|uniref:Benzoylformate decarboxylase n=1 Tax=Croceibacterium atlanticum TaxID=1267766 RepID=A0A0F7KTW4_9SPHN|nr:benzoylformate decarboxylase [Croceibacterium atlanticum]AKH43818.1 Benzoylformate decarboxylase [Croceibacterium atlanticum]MBB5733732.1 benzoylformate decarboxylase [Croceibacterium atlanticum]